MDEKTIKPPAEILREDKEVQQRLDDRFFHGTGIKMTPSLTLKGLVPQHYLLFCRLCCAWVETGVMNRKFKEEEAGNIQGGGWISSGHFKCHFGSQDH